MRKTKIICTIGPASEKPEILSQIIEAGMNVSRHNFSHGDHEEHAGRINLVKELAKKHNKEIAVMLDTKGPEIRTGKFEPKKVELQAGAKFTVHAGGDVIGNTEECSVTYAGLANDVKPGDTILIDDGLVGLTVESIDGNQIHCTVQNTGFVATHKGVNVPGVSIKLPALTEKDIADLKFGCEIGVNLVAASFIRKAADVEAIRKVLVENGKPDIQIIAKIENSEGVEKMDDIIKVADGIMVARGDLGVEVPAEDVPLIQKELIKKCKAAGKVVITATQMLESMQENPRPTRAEVSDVANAIYDGTDAIMLSGESAQGKYPEEAVMVMNKIAIKTESTLDYASLHRKAVRTASDDPSEAICMSVAEIATKFNVAAIVAFTESGFTAKKMSRYRPECPIIAATPYEKTTKKLAINWGVKSVTCKHMDTTEGLLNLAEVIAKENGVNAGETILVTGGTPGVRGTTSYLQLITVK